jgi:hypothetical protein
MASGYGGIGTKEMVKTAIDSLEVSPSKTQPTSPVFGNKRQGGPAESAAESVPGFKEKKGKK